MPQFRSTVDVLDDYHNVDGLLRLWGAAPAIWVPPAVEVVEIPRVAGSALYYPMGTQWPDVVEESGDPIGVLQKSGWRRRDDAEGLVKDLVHLAQDPRISRVRRFAQKWGPLWKCFTSSHGECWWSRAWMAHRSRTRCVWRNVEPVDLFLTEARRIKAILAASTELRQARRVPGSVWKHMEWGWLSVPGNSNLSLATQRHIAAAIINQRLALLPGAPTLWVQWGERNPTLEIESGMGFIRAAWLHVAQLVAGVSSLYICDGCGKPYLRERQAKKGQKQFCPKCGSRASKRLWWRENRGMSTPRGD